MLMLATKLYFTRFNLRIGPYCLVSADRSEAVSYQNQLFEYNIRREPSCFNPAAI